MSHYYSSIKGTSRTDATRCGSKSSGIATHVRTWDFGISVVIEHKNGKDIASVYKTGGSNDASNCQLLMLVTKDGQL